MKAIVIGLLFMFVLLGNSLVLSETHGWFQADGNSFRNRMGYHYQNIVSENPWVQGFIKLIPNSIVMVYTFDSIEGPLQNFCGLSSENSLVCIANMVYRYKNVIIPQELKLMDVLPVMDDKFN